MAEMSFHLSDFEGPLDLLLYLITKHKLDILDIEISELLRQYMLAIENREDRDLEVRSEFLEMAARLVHIKTVSMLPKHEKEADELKTTLSGELMEYRLCRIAAGYLAERADKYRVYVRRPMEIEADMTYRLTHPASLLRSAIEVSTGRLQRRRPVPQKAFSGIVEHRVVSVSSQIIHLLRRMYGQSELTFDEVFADRRDRSELVAMFLALLELMKVGRVSVSDSGVVTLSHAKRKQEEVSEA
jgi:segregation and condensation protein A